MEKSSDLYRRNNNGSITLPCITPDTMLASFLWQQSTITFCDRFDRNCHYILTKHQTSNTLRTELIENFPTVDAIKGCSEINLHDPIPLAHSPMHFAVYGTHKSASEVPRNFLQANCVFAYRQWRTKSSGTNKHLMLKHLKTFWCYGYW